MFVVVLLFGKGFGELKKNNNNNNNKIIIQANFVTYFLMSRERRRGRENNLNVESRDGGKLISATTDRDGGVIKGFQTLNLTGVHEHNFSVVAGIKKRKKEKKRIIRTQLKMQTNKIKIKN